MQNISVHKAWLKEWLEVAVSLTLSKYCLTAKISTILHLLLIKLVKSKGKNPICNLCMSLLHKERVACAQRIELTDNVRIYSNHFTIYQHITFCVLFQSKLRLIDCNYFLFGILFHELKFAKTTDYTVTLANPSGSQEHAPGSKFFHFHVVFSNKITNTRLATNVLFGVFDHFPARDGGG